MTITPLTHNAVNVEFTSFRKDLQEDIFEINHTNKFHDDHLFSVIFRLKIVSVVNEYKLELEFISTFKLEELITDKFKNSHFPIINAPAIAYPFLRSYVSFLTLNSGSKAAILPSINFAQHKNSQDIP